MQKKQSVKHFGLGFGIEYTKLHKMLDIHARQRWYSKLYQNLHFGNLRAVPLDPVGEAPYTPY